MADTFDYEKAAKENARAFKAAGIGMGASQSGVGSFFENLPGVSEKLTKKFSPMADGLDMMSSATGMTYRAFGLLQSAVSGSLDTWRDLSAYGASFSNDLIQMHVAAASARMSVSDFSELIKQNGAGLAFLGGSVNKGAENFAKMSDAMFSSQGFSKVSDDLRSIGYSSTELNKVLALSVTMQRTALNAGKDGEESQRAAIASAQSLAFEMDKNAKLLGISRQEQMKVLEQAKLDSAVQARLRLIEIQDGPAAAKKAADEYYKGLAVAQAEGVSELYKDVFANNGVITNETAAKQATLLNKQAEGITDMATAALKGNSEMMDAGISKSMEGAAENDKDVQLLQMRTLGDLNKGINDVIGKTAISSQTVADIINTRVREKGITPEEATKQVLAEIKAGQKPDQTGGAQITDMAIKLGSRLDDVKAGIAQGVSRPLVDKIAPDVKGIKDLLLSKSIAPTIKIKAQTMAADVLGIKKGTDQKAAEDTEAKKESSTAASKASEKTSKEEDTGTEGKKATLNTVADKLDTLNTSVKSLSSYMEDIKNLTDRQLRATKGLSNDRFNN